MMLLGCILAHRTGRKVQKLLDEVRKKPVESAVMAGCCVLLWTGLQIKKLGGDT